MIPGKWVDVILCLSFPWEKLKFHLKTHKQIYIYIYIYIYSGAI